MRKKLILLTATIMMSLAANGTSYATQQNADGAVDYSQLTLAELDKLFMDDSFKERTFEDMQKIGHAIAEKQKQEREQKEREEEEARLKYIAENPYKVRKDERDSKSGLTPYYDNKLKLAGYMDRNDNIVLPAKWKTVAAFFAGYSIATTDNSTIIINEQGETVSTIFDYQMYIYRVQRFVENNQGLFGYLSGISGDDSCYHYATFSLDGKMDEKVYPQFVSSVDKEVNLVTEYSLGTFRDGSANIYRYTTPYIISNIGGMNWTYTPEAVGSITVNGIFSTDINSKSEFVVDDNPITKYGEKQFSQVSNNTNGWKQDKGGWWFQNSDGTYPTNTWKEINGKQYYFGSDGYMFSNRTTPDGYNVGEDGAWIQ